MLFAMIITLVVACEKSVVAPSDPLKVKGVLIDKQNVPIPNAVMEAVLIQKSKTAIVADQVLQRDTTDEDGNFEFSALQSDLTNVDLRIIHPDLKPFQENFIKALGNQDRSKVVLQMLYQDTCCGRIELTVRSAKDSSVISGVEVRLNQGQTIKRKASTNSEGRLVFEEVCGGTYWVRLSKTGYNVKEEDGFRIEGCDSSHYVVRTLYMTAYEKDSCCNGIMKINPVDKKTGDLLTGAIVKLRKNGTELSRLTVGNEPVVFRELCKGTYSMLIIKDGYTPMEFAVEMGCSDSVELKKELSAIECCNGIIKLKVQDSTGAGIPEATVNMFKGNTKIGTVYTNAEGRVIMTGICQGDYSFSIIRKNYKSIEFSQAMGCDDTVSLEKTLYYDGADTCCKGIIKVYPKDASTKVALNGATVKMFIGDKLVKTETVVEGVATFKELCTGKYSFLIVKDGYKSIDFVVELPCNQTKELEKLLNKSESDSCCNGVAKIFVRNPNNERIYNALVKLWKGGTLLGEYHTNNDGYVLLTKLCPGTYGVNLSQDGYKGMEFSFTLGCDDTVTYEKILNFNEKDTCCNGVVKFILKNDGGEPLANTAVKMTLSGTVVRSGNAGTDGTITFRELCKGVYNIRVARDGFKVQEFSIELNCNDSLEVERILERDTCCTAVLQLHVIDDSTGTAINEARIEVKRNGDMFTDGYTNAEGNFGREKFCAPSTYIVHVIKDGYVTREFTFTYTACTTKSETIRLKRN